MGESRRRGSSQTVASFWWYRGVDEAEWAVSSGFAGGENRQMSVDKGGVLEWGSQCGMGGRTRDSLSMLSEKRKIEEEERHDP